MLHQHESGMPLMRVRPLKSQMAHFKSGMLIALSLCSSSVVMAADTACEVTLPGGMVDVRAFPATPGETVLNGRNDGNPATCTIVSLGAINTVDYPNGLQINTNGTGLAFKLVEIDILNGLTVDDAGNGNGLVTFSGDRFTRIAGPVAINNKAKLKFITHNTLSSTSRLRLQDAYFNIAADSELQAEFKLGDTTGKEFIIGAIHGDGDLSLSNAGTTPGSGTIVIANGDNQDYTYTGDIYYNNQNAPSLAKKGNGTFTFTGDVKKSSGDSIGFTDGFDLISIDGGAFETTTESFILATKVQLQGGDLILNQATDGTTGGASFSGNNTIYKRGAGSITLGGIDQQFKGNVAIEEGSLGLLGNASLRNTDAIRIASGATLDLSQIGGSTVLTRVSGGGTITLGNKTISRFTSIKPGDSIGVLDITGSGQVNLSGTLLEIEIDPTRAAGNAPGTTHDQLQVAGNVQIGTTPVIELVDVQQGASPSAFLNGREFTVLTAASGLAGISPLAIQEDLSSFHAFIGADPEISIITDTSVSVKFGIKTVANASKDAGKVSSGSSKNTANSTQQYLQQTTGLTGNQQPTQQQLQNNAALQNLTTAKLSNAASNNNPEAYSSNLTLTLEYADLVANSVMNHASGAGLGLQQLDGTAAHDGRLWIDVAYVDGQVDGSSNETGDFDYNLGTLVIGADLLQSKTNTFGVFGSAGLADMDEHDNIRQDIDGDIYHLGVYNQYRFGDGYKLSGVLAGFYGDYDTSRQNLDPNGAAAPRSKADFSSYGATIGAKLYKSFATSETIAMTPSLGFTYTRITQEKVKENDGGVNYDYRIEEADAETAILGIGLDTAYTLQESSTPLVADFRVRYEYDAYADKNDTHDIDASLAGQPNTDFVGQNRGEHGLILGAGIAGQTGKNTTIGGGVSYATHSNGTEVSVNGNFTLSW